MKANTPQAVQKVLDHVREQIREGFYAADSMLPAEMDLAADLQVSRGTVRRAIERLTETGELTRRPHSRPIVSPKRKLSTEARDVYVWVSRPVSHYSALQLIKGVSHGLAGTQYRMVVREPSRFEGSAVKAEERRFLFELLANEDVAGAIIERDPYAEDDDLMVELAAQKPLVFMDAPPPPTVRADFVGTSNTTAARACVEFLIELGHSHIVCVADTDFPEPAQDRILGYWRAMRSAGIESLGRVVVACNLPAGAEGEVKLSGRYARALSKNSLFPGWPARAAQEIFAMNPRPTALFVCHDAMAYWMCALIEGRGLRVPEDISVIGFDWIARSNRSVPDILTTAAQDFEGFGRHAANLLLDRLGGEHMREPRHVLLDAPLVIRSSTGSDLMLPPMEAAIENWGQGAQLTL